MKNVLITGAQGFIGSLLGQYLSQRGHKVFSFTGDILDESLGNSILKLNSIDFVFHLAGISHVEACEKNPELAHKVNCFGTHKVAEEFFKFNPNASFYFFSTAQVYNIDSSSQTTKLNEHSPLLPKGVYSSTKLEAELNLKNEFAHKHKIRVLRLFNHTHKSQDPAFFVPGIYNQLLEIKKSGKPTLKVGNIDIQRDISIVSSIFPKIHGLIDNESKVSSSFEVFNICSGIGRNLKNLIQIMASQMNVSIEIQVDPSRVRKNDPQSIIGDQTKLAAHLHNLENVPLSDDNFIEQFLSR